MDALPDFSEKVVTFYVAHWPPEHASTLQSPTFQQHAGRYFVVGLVVSHQKNHWAANAQLSIAWDQVSQYIVYESTDEFLRRMANTSPRFLRFFR